MCEKSVELFIDIIDDYSEPFRPEKQQIAPYWVTAGRVSGRVPKTSLISKSSGFISELSSPVNNQGPKIVPYVPSDFEEIKHQEIELEFSEHPQTASPNKEGGEYESHYNVASEKPSQQPHK
jgi:hypothetical protein